MKLFSRSKKTLLATLIVSLFGVGVAAISTLAWFQIDSAPANPSMITSDPNIEVQNANVKGYKKESTLSDFGMPKTTDVELIDDSTGSGPKENPDLEGSDLDFDVPTKGYGYYLIKKSGGGYVPKYNGVVYATKMIEYSSSLDVVSEVYAENVRLAQGEKYKVMHYYYDGDIHRTQYNNITITTQYPSVEADTVCSITDSEMTVKTGKGGTYTIWVDHRYARVDFVDELNALSSYNISRANKHNKAPTRAINDGKHRFNVFVNKKSWWPDDDAVLGIKMHDGDPVKLGADTDIGSSVAGKSKWREVELGGNSYYFQTIEVDSSYGITWWAPQIKRYDPSTGSQWGSDVLTSENTQDWTYTGNNRKRNTWYIDENNSLISNWLLYYKIKLVYGTNHKSDQYIIHNAKLSSYPISHPGAVPTGYRFDGWYTNSTCTTPVGSSITGDITLYAKYTDISPSSIYYTVNLYDQDNIARDDWVTPVAYVWGDSSKVYPSTNDIAVHSTSTHNGHNIYTFRISKSYTGFLFYKTGSKTGANQTGDLENKSTNDNRYYVMKSATDGDGHRTGEWVDTLSSEDTNRTVYLYDAAGTNSSPSWSNVRLLITNDNVWPETQTISPTSTTTHTVYSPTTNGVNVVHKVYKFDFSSSYSTLQFKADNSKQSASLTYNSSKPYFVMTDANGTGSWYTALTDDTAPVTYYYFDNRANRWNPPRAYLWNSGKDSDVTCIYPNEIHAYPGIAMTQISAETAAAKGLSQDYGWQITTTSSYDKIIFDNGYSGAANQTNDLDTAGMANEVALLVDQDQETNKWNVEWADTFKTVKFKPVYFIDGQKTSFDDDGAYLSTTDATPLFTRYNPLKRGDLYTNHTTREQIDNTHSIYYNFDIEATNSLANIYTDANCETPLVDGGDISDNVVNDEAILYVKYTTFSSLYSTIYVDTYDSDATGHSDAKWTGVWYTFTDGTEKVQATKVGNELFRLTAPTSYDFRLSNGLGDVGGNNYTAPITGGIPSGDKPLLHIYEAAYGSNHTWCWGTAITEKRGEAIIQISDTGNDDDWDDLRTMEEGDMRTNYYVFEHSVSVPVGKYLRVVISGDNAPTAIKNLYTDGEVIFDYSKYYSYTPTDYVASDGGKIKTANYSGSVRFNFYISMVEVTKNNYQIRLTIAMLPNAGNGYYIIPYTSTTNTYSGAIKMLTMDGNPKAMYDDFYAAKDSMFFIKSFHNLAEKEDYTFASGYTDYVDTHAQDSDIPEHVFKFKTSAHYVISINSDNSISFAITSGNGAFVLNQLNLNNIATTAQIKAQDTSFVIKVPFVYNNNKFSSKMSLIITNPLSDFIGVTLFVSTADLSDACYTSGRANDVYSTLTNGSSVDDANNLTITDRALPYYAYILVDYLPLDYGGGGIVDYSSFGDPVSLRDSLSFYLQANQI